jgi:hypothetical protein
MIQYPSRELKIMRISDILFWHNQLTGRYRDDPQLDLRQARFNDAMTKAAGDYEEDRLLKRFWELKRLENQPSGPQRLPRHPVAVGARQKRQQRRPAWRAVY